MRKNEDSARIGCSNDKCNGHACLLEMLPFPRLYRDPETWSVIAAMGKLIAVSVPEESAYIMVEALVLEVRIAKAELRSVNAEEELFAG